MIACADTSFLASLYGEDSNSEQAVRQHEALRPTLLVTPFNELELLTAFEARVFRSLASQAEAEESMQAFRADVAMGVLSRRPFPENAWARAIMLSQLHARTLGSRTLDILQVAIAFELEAQILFTFDKEQAKLAKRAGLTVRPRR